MTLSQDFQARYGVAATTADASHFRRAAGRFWKYMAQRHAGWLQPEDGVLVQKKVHEVFDGSYAAWHIAMLLDVAPATIDYRIKASVAYWLRDDLADVCNT